jgi:site-specific DNA-cytosine methylase
MLRAIREIQPRWVVGENVLGLVNWSGGLVFHEVQADLEAEGYEVQPYVLPAVSVNAPHRRDRVWFVAYSNGIGLRRQSDGSGEPRFTGKNDQRNDWQNFPTVSPIRMRDDGVSSKLLRFVVNELYDKISNTSEENRIQNLQEVWQSVQSEEIWEQVRGLYSLESKDVLFQTMQLYSPERAKQGELSPFSEELCQPILQHLSKYKEFRCSPQGQELAKQRYGEYSDIMCDLPHEVALAARAYTNSIRKFEAWHRQESIKAAGNAIVPQVVFQIFKAINEYREKYP